MEVAGANRRWPFQFTEKSRVGGYRESAVAQLFSLGSKTHHYEKERKANMVSS
jgi:hypothetical protein